MKLSEEQTKELATVSGRLSTAIGTAIHMQDGEDHSVSEYLRIFAETCISIGVEIAMQHRHTSLEPVYSGAQLIRYDDQPTSEAIRQAEELER